MTIKNARTAVVDYLKYNNGGRYDPHYGYMYLDRGTGEVWTTEHYNLGHNEYIVYDDDAIIKLDKYMSDEYYELIQLIDDDYFYNENKDNDDFYNFISVDDYIDCYSAHIEDIAAELCNEWERERNKYTI